MENTYKVKLGDKANIFHDPVSKVTVKKGEVVEITMTQARCTKVQKAFQGGFLVKATEEAETKKAFIEPKIEETPLEKFKRLMDKGATNEKMAKAFKMDTLKSLAESLDIVPEDDDTKETLIEAIKEEFSDSSIEATEEAETEK